MAIYDEAEMMTRVAWLYYVGELNQAQVSERLGLTRARVNKLLQVAREKGIVSININRTHLGLIELEDKIAGHFGLDFCMITPQLGLDSNHPSQSEIARRAVGNQASKFLRKALANAPALTIGMGWGRTLDQLAKNIAGLHSPQAKYVSLMGSLTASSAFNPFEVVQSMAANTGGEGYFLPVPFITNSLEDRNTLLEQSVVAGVMKMAREIDLAFISVGELTKDSFLVQQGMVNTTQITELIDAGAVGDTNGIFFDHMGKSVQHELNDRTVAVELGYLKRTKTVLLSAGIEKANATMGLLNSGVVSGLIVDGDSAVLISKVVE